MMGGLVSFILLGVAVLFRGQQLAPNLFIGCSFDGGQINRQARRISQAINVAGKLVGDSECFKSRNIYIVMIVLHEKILAKPGVQTCRKDSV